MILFLDFDGVLHPANPDGSEFCRVAVLAAWLGRWPGVEVVISSSWRQIHSPPELVKMLGPVVGPRVIGCTPVGKQAGRDFSIYPTPALPRFEREAEIRQWMKDSRQPKRPWVALDDMAFLFSPGCPQLVLCDGREGIALETLDRLTVHARRAALTAASVSIRGEAS